MKTCTKCLINKPLSDFYMLGLNKVGYRSQCKDCTNTKSRAQYDAEKRREWNLRGRYGLSLDDFDDMVTAQNGLCAACFKPTDAWHVDHRHDCCPGANSCGKCIRALLCPACNIGIGTFGDDPYRLMNAALYLSIHDPRRAS